MILNFPPDDPESVIDGVVINVDFGESLRSSGRHPLLEAIVVQHHGCSSRSDRMLAEKDRKGEKYGLSYLFVMVVAHKHQA